MASLLRQIVAGPRARHPEAGLDLCYVTDNIIATYVELAHCLFPIPSFHPSNYSIEARRITLQMEIDVY